MKRVLTFALLLLISARLFAEHVEPATALKVANTFMPEAKFEQNTKTAYNNIYIFSGEDCFVIVSADDRVQPILAYSEENPFKTTDMPENVASWIENWNKEIQYICDNKLEPTEKVMSQWATLKKGQRPDTRSRGGVGPLIKTKWAQGNPYNKFCPECSDGTHCVTGCVATAMTQIMNYWKWPFKGQGEHSYITRTNHYQLSVDFSAAKYDWGNMPNTINTSTSTMEEINAVAELSYHCGVSVDMDYGCGGSGAYTEDVPYALENYFSYQEPTLCSKYGHNNSEWSELLKTELDKRHPIYYSARDTYQGAGHAFIIDGYRESNTIEFSINWGWNGYCDGYYSIDNLNTGSYNFSDNHRAIIDIVPEEENSVIAFPGDNMPTYNTPFNNYYKNSWNETIYPKSLFDSECMIKELHYMCVNQNPYKCSSLKIYMGERSSGEHSSNTDWTPISDLQLVYSGTNINIGESDAQTIVLEVPFKYTNTGNLVIVVSKTSPKWSSTLKWGYTSANKSCLYRQNDYNTSYANYPNGASGTLSNERADISLTVNYDINSTVIVHAGYNSSASSPFDNYYKYSWNEMIYSKGYFPNPCTINSLSFYCTDASYYTCRNLDIYIGKRPSDTHADTFDWINPNNLHLVYSASGKVIGSKVGWQEFVLDTPYEYYPDENLVVVVAKAGYGCTDQLKWSCSDTYQSLCYQSDRVSSVANSYPNGDDGEFVPRANVKFSVEYNDAQPSSVTIGDGTLASYSSPFDNYYKYSWNESIYPGDALPQHCTITSISYDCVQESYYTCRQLDIYMGVTSKSQHNNSYDWIDPDNLTLVYEHPGMAIGRGTGWNEFTLDTPFEYNGGNLVIVVAKAGYGCTSQLKWACSNTARQSLCLHSDRVYSVCNSYPNGQRGVYAPLANVKLGLRTGDRSSGSPIYQELEISENNESSELINSDNLDEVNIYPNPAKDVINIEMEGDNFEYMLYNELGQVVRRGNSCGKSQINVEDCQKGLYLIKIATSEKTSTHKIIIE